MSKYSCYRVRFELQNAAGKQVGGPWMIPVGISGGSRNDQHTPSVTTALASAISSNLATFIQDQNGGLGGAPQGSIAILSFDHGVTGTPDIYV